MVVLLKVAQRYGYQESGISWLLVAGSLLLVAGSLLLVPCCWLLVACCWLLII